MCWWPTVHRFWYAADGTTLPPSFHEAETWSNYHQIIHTNIVLDKWSGFAANFRVVPFKHETSHLDPRLIKYAFQFSLPRVWDTPVLYADWDFRLQNALLMPWEPTILISEHVRVRRGQDPKNVIRPGVRLHLGLSQFQPKDPIACEIHQAIICERKALNGIHTAQAIVKKHNLKVFDPLVFNPFPPWMHKPHYGELHYGAMMPSIANVLECSVTVNMWSGHERFARADVLEALSNVIHMPIQVIEPPVDLSAPDNKCPL